MVLAIIGVCLTALGMMGACTAVGVKLVRWMSRLEMKVDRMVYNQKLVHQIPWVVMRVGAIEKHLDISSPDMPLMPNGDGNDEH